MIGLVHPMVGQETLTSSSEASAAILLASLRMAIPTRYSRTVCVYMCMLDALTYIRIPLQILPLALLVPLMILLYLLKYVHYQIWHCHDPVHYLWQQQVATISSGSSSCPATQLHMYQAMNRHYSPNCIP